MRTERFYGVLGKLQSAIRDPEEFLIVTQLIEIFGEEIPFHPRPDGPISEKELLWLEPVLVSFVRERRQARDFGASRAAGAVLRLIEDRRRSGF